MPLRGSAQMMAIEQRAEESGAQVSRHYQSKGIDLRFQHRAEGANPNHLHRHRRKPSREQEPLDQPPAARRQPTHPSHSRLRTGFRLWTLDFGLWTLKSQPHADGRDDEIARRGDPKRMPKP